MKPDLLPLLRCPVTKQPLRAASGDELPQGWEDGMVTADGKIAYPVRNGIPLLVSSEAVRSDTSE